MTCPPRRCEEAAELCNELEYKIRMAEAEMARWDEEYDIELYNFDYYDEVYVEQSARAVMLDYPIKPTRFERIVAFFTEWFYNCSEGQFKALLAMCVISALIAMGWALLLHASVGY